MDKFMKAAMDEAKQGLAEGGIPIGSVLVKSGKIIGRGHNRRVQKNSQVFHAEIDCLENAGRIRDYRGTVLYSTLMPCYLCAGAVVQFGIKKVVVGENFHYRGKGTLKIMKEHGVEVVILNEEECIRMMHDFVEKNPELWAEDTGQI
ncbi:MAG: nucleoside deaminase [Candidatus Hadarchaeota archaeon]